MHRRESHSDPGPLDRIHNKPATRAVKLPRALARPSFSEPSPEDIAIISPDLADIPIPYIKQELRNQAGPMLAGLRAVSHVPRMLNIAFLPQSFQIPESSPPTASPPTHVIAARSSKAPSQSVCLYPVHDVTLLVHFSGLRLPPRYPGADGSVARAMPVLEVALPSPEAFAVIHSFLYNHRIEGMMRALLPLSESTLQNLTTSRAILATRQSRAVVDQMGSQIAQRAYWDVENIMKIAMHVKSVWQNMAALRISIMEMWDTLDLAWDILLAALQQATSAPLRR